MSKTLLKQTQADLSVIFKDDHTGNDSTWEGASLVDGVSATLQRDMNFLRTQVKNMLGETNWFDSPADTINQLAANTTLAEKHFIIGINKEENNGPDSAQAGVHSVKAGDFTIVVTTGDSLDIKVDSGSLQNVTFTAGARTAAQIVSEFNGSITGATASATANDYVIISSDSTVDGTSQLELLSSSNCLGILGFSSAEGATAAISGKTYFQFIVSEAESTTASTDGIVSYANEGSSYHFANGEIFNSVGEQLIDGAAKEVFFRDIDYITDGAGSGNHVVTGQTYVRNASGDKTTELPPYFGGWGEGNTADDMIIDVIYPFRKSLDSMGPLDLTQSTFRQISAAERDQESVADINRLLGILGAAHGDTSLTYASALNITQNGDVELVIGELDAALGNLSGTSSSLTSSDVAGMIGATTLTGTFASTTIVDALNELAADIATSAASITLQDAYDNDADGSGATIATNVTDEGLIFTSNATPASASYDLLALQMDQSSTFENSGDALSILMGDGGDAGKLTGSAIRVDYNSSQYVPGAGENLIGIHDGSGFDFQVDKGGLLELSNVADATGKLTMFGTTTGIDVTMAAATDTALLTNGEVKVANGGTSEVVIQDGNVNFSAAGLVDAASGDLGLTGSLGVNVTATAEDIALNATTAANGGIALNGPTGTIQSKIDLGVAADDKITVQADNIDFIKNAGEAVVMNNGVANYFEWDASENLILGDDTTAGTDAYVKINNDADVEINSQGSGVLVTGRGSVSADFGKAVSGTMDLNAGTFDMDASVAFDLVAPDMDLHAATFDLRDSSDADASVIALATGDLVLGKAAKSTISINDGASGTFDNIVIDDIDMTAGLLSGMNITSSGNTDWDAAITSGASLIQAINETMTAAQGADTLQEVYDNQSDGVIALSGDAKPFSVNDSGAGLLFSVDQTGAEDLVDVNAFLDVDVSAVGVVAIDANGIIKAATAGTALTLESAKMSSAGALELANTGATALEILKSDTGTFKIGITATELIGIDASEILTLGDAALNTIVDAANWSVNAAGELATDGKITVDSDGTAIQLGATAGQIDAAALAVKSTSTTLTLEAATDLIFDDSGLSAGLAAGMKLSSVGDTDWDAQITTGASLVQAINEVVVLAGNGSSLQKVYDNQANGVLAIEDLKPLSLADSASANYLKIDPVNSKVQIDKLVDLNAVLDIDVSTTGTPGIDLVMPASPLAAGIDINMNAATDTAIDANGVIKAATGGTAITIESAKVSSAGAFELSNTGATALEILKSDTGTFKLGITATELIGIDASEVLTLGDASLNTLVDAANWSVDASGNILNDGHLKVDSDGSVINIGVTANQIDSSSLNLFKEDAGTLSIGVNAGIELVGIDATEVLTLGDSSTNTIVDAANWSVNAAGEVATDGKLTVDSDGANAIQIGNTANQIDAAGLTLVASSSNLNLDSTAGEIFFDDTRTGAIQFSGTGFSTLPAGAGSILEALNVNSDGSVKRKGVGVGNGSATQSIATITGDGGLTYFSNNGGTGTSSTSEGFFMDVFVNGQLLQAGSGLDYTEDGTTGTARVNVTFLNTPYPGASDNVTVVVRKV